MKRVIFTGSRHWKHETSVVDALMELDPTEWIVVTGGAKGLDTLAAQYSAKLGFKVESYKAKWDKYGRAAGPIRNQYMLGLENVKLVIAFPKEGGKGTQHMIRIAKAADVPVVEVELP